jgi:hypothetical protein
MKVKPRTHLALDTVIFVLFVLTMLSGLVTWLALPGGFQGGRNPAYSANFLALSRDTWKDLHLWAGLAMGGLASLHLFLHLPWVKCQIERLFTKQKRRTRQPECPVIQPGTGK